MKMAADGDHYRIAFDKPDTWSQKYNLVWDKLLGLDVFPPEVARREVAYYKKVIQRYGVPLDSRTRLTKADWCLWSATMAETRRTSRRSLRRSTTTLNETTARLPFVDSYVTDDAKSDGMRARPVIGGRVHQDARGPARRGRSGWSRDRAKVGDYAPAPVPPRITEVMATSRREAGRVAVHDSTKPADDWTRPGFDDSDWKHGTGRVRHRRHARRVVGTTWNTPDIWLRRR